MVGSGSLAAMGIWCLLFGGDGGHGGEKRGWDGGEKKGWDGGQAGKREGKSRVSGWPFRNQEATRVKLENREEKRRVKEEKDRREGARRRGGGGCDGSEMGMEMEDMGGKSEV